MTSWFSVDLWDTPQSRHHLAECESILLSTNDFTGPGLNLQWKGLHLHQSLPSTLQKGHSDLTRIENQQQWCQVRVSRLWSLFLCTVTRHAQSFLNKTAPSQGKELSLQGAPNLHRLSQPFKVDMLGVWLHIWRILLTLPVRISVTMK